MLDIWIDFIGTIPFSLVTSNPTSQRTNTYTFQEVTEQELMQLRLSKKSGCVYKKNGKLYYTAIPNKLHFIGNGVEIHPHLCGKNCKMVCRGCPRTSDLTVSYQEKNDKDFTDAVIDSWRIEKYPFCEGFEAFNMSGSGDASIITSCLNYEAGRRYP